MRHHAVELTLRERLSQINYPAGKCAVCNQIQNGMSPNRGEEGANTEKRNTRGDWTRSTSGIALSALNVLASVCTLYIVLEFPPPHPKLLRTPQFLTHFTSKCASRHNAVHFFNISTSKSGPILRCFVFHFEIGFAPQRRATFHLSSPQMSPHRFSEPTFQPSGATKPPKNTAFRDFSTFSRTCIFFLF